MNNTSTSRLRPVAVSTLFAPTAYAWVRGFYSPMHTITTWLRTAGVSEEDRMALTGHNTRESHQSCSHTDKAALRDAIAKPPSLKPENP